MTFQNPDSKIQRHTLLLFIKSFLDVFGGMADWQSSTENVEETIKTGASLRRFSVWCLMFGASLELGAWSLELAL